MKNRKVGILLAIGGIVIGIVVILDKVALPIFKENFAGVLNARLSGFTMFVINAGEIILDHVVVEGCVALAFFVAGRLIFRHTKIWQNSN
jgi:type II secretory pathway component PulF